MLNPFPFIPEWALSAMLPLNRGLHIVFTALLVGGTLFYEFVIPKAIEDLKEEQQLAVLGRVRWVVRQLVIYSAIVLVLSGCVTLWNQWPMYHGLFGESRTFLMIHIGLGLLALVVAIRLTFRARTPRGPLFWLRVNFVILIVAIFAASIARYLRMEVQANIERANPEVFGKYYEK